MPQFTQNVSRKLAPLLKQNQHIVSGFPKNAGEVGSEFVQQIVKQKDILNAMLMAYQGVACYVNDRGGGGWRGFVGIAREGKEETPFEWWESEGACWQNDTMSAGEGSERRKTTTTITTTRATRARLTSRKGSLSQSDKRVLSSAIR